MLDKYEIFFYFGLDFRGALLKKKIKGEKTNKLEIIPNPGNSPPNRNMNGRPKT